MQDNRWVTKDHGPSENEITDVDVDTRISQLERFRLQRSSRKRESRGPACYNGVQTNSEIIANKVRQQAQFRGNRGTTQSK